MDDACHSTANGAPHSALLSVARQESGERVDIGALSELKRQGLKRPECFCLACDQLLVARLGEKKRHHFAHKPAPESERCWATSPEGEIHLSAKRVVELLLVRACARSETVTARLPCPSCGAPGDAMIVTELAPSHRVLVEFWGDPGRTIKPDVQVVDREGRVLLFIEVRVMHAVDDAKVRFVLGGKVPLLEIHGRAVLHGLKSPEFTCVRHLNLPPADSCSSCVAREEAQRAAEARRKAEDAARQKEQTRRAELRPEAERHVRARMSAETKTEVISWCHLRVFVGAKLVRSAHLEVSITWHSTNAVLRLAEEYRTALIKEWTAQLSHLQDIYATELPATARRFARCLAGEVGLDASIDTFSGFRTKYFRDSPPKYERIYDEQTRSWMTMYPWRELARSLGHRELSSLVKQYGWRTRKSVSGHTHVEARSVDHYLRQRRSTPSLQRPPPEQDWRWSGEVEAEIDSLITRGAAQPPSSTTIPASIVPH